MSTSLEALFLGLFDYRQRTESLQEILIQGSETASEDLWSLYEKHSYVPDNVAWALLNIFTEWQDSKAKCLAIKLWQEGKNFTSDLMGALQKTTGNSLANSNIWESFLSLEKEELIDELQILENGFEIICHCEESRKQRLTFTLNYDEAHVLHGMHCQSHCGFVSEGNLEAIKEVASTIDYAELKTLAQEGSTDHEVTLNRDCDTEDLSGPRLLSVIKAVGQTADNLEKQLLGLDIDWKKV